MGGTTSLSSHINDPQHWRTRPAELRSLAEDVRHPEAKARMLRIYEEYEHPAKRAEQRNGAAQRRPERPHRGAEGGE